MAVDPNALTLSEYATQSNDPQIAEVAFSMIQAGSVFTDIPLITQQTLSKRGSRFVDNLAAPTWTPINAEPTTVKSKATPYDEQLWALRNNIDVDELIAMDENAVGDFVDTQSQAYLRGTAFDLNDKFINNNHLTGDPNAYVGLRARLDSPSIYGTVSTNKIDCGGVDLSSSGMSAATANNFITFIQQALDEMGAGDGTGVVAYANDDLLRKIDRGVRTLGAGGGWDMSKDAYDRHVMTYKNAKIRPIGRKAPTAGGAQAQIITSTETANGAADTGGTFTSMYFVKTGRNDFAGWQPWALKPRPEYRLDNGVIKRVLFSWAVGLWNPNTRATARLYNIKVA